MIRFALLACCTLGWPLCLAAMNKCVSPEGRVTYTSEPCPDNARSATRLKLQEAAPARTSTPEEAFLNARRDFDAGADAYARHFDPPPAGEALETFRAAYDLAKRSELRDYRIVERQESADGSTVRIRAEATGRNLITGERGPFVGEATLARKSGRWVLTSDQWSAALLR